MKVIVAAIAIAFALASSGCGNDKSKPFVKRQLEVSPGKLVEVQLRAMTPNNHQGASAGEIWEAIRASKLKRYYEMFEVHIPWGNTNLLWKGFAVPICIREFSDTFYIIALDRTTLGVTADAENQQQFKYYRQDGGSFKEIVPSDFPKQIAIQNDGFYLGRSFSVGEKRCDGVRSARELDVADPCFQRSYTAFVWLQLATGIPFHEAHKRRGTVDEKMLSEYARTNRPIKLTIIPEEQSGVAELQ